MNKHERYNKSEKGRERTRRYRATGSEAYLRIKTTLRKRIETKRIKIVELERILQDAEKIRY